MPQKRGLKKIERRQQVRQRKEKRQEKTRVEKISGSVDIPNLGSEELIDNLRRMKAITPTEVATQFNITVSLAKRLLEELRRNEVIDIVSRSHNLKVYALSRTRASRS